MKISIEKGDKVLVQLTEQSYLEGEVLYVPRSEGDFWVIAEISFSPTSNSFLVRPSQIHYVQRFIHMTLL